MPNVVNYVAETNPFNLATPPTWWLYELKRFDSDLVVLPSQQEFVYRLGRRSKNAPRLLSSDYKHPLVEAMPAPDTIMFAKHGLVPVTTILGAATFDFRIFTTLKARDIWAVGGGNKAADILDERDLTERKKTDSWIHDELDARSGDYWASLHYRTGARVSMAYAERSSKALKVLDKRRVKPLKHDW